MRSPGCTRRSAPLSRMREPARSSRPVVVITGPRIGGGLRRPDRFPRCAPSPLRGRRGETPIPGARRMAIVAVMTTFSALQCPVCGRPVEDPAPAACRTCGLPAVGHAAGVVTRIGVTLREIAADRDALLATLRGAAPGP